MSFFQKGKMYKYEPRNWPGRWMGAPMPEETEFLTYMTATMCNDKKFEVKVPIKPGDNLTILDIMVTNDGERMVHGLHKMFAGWIRLESDDWVRIRL